MVDSSQGSSSPPGSPVDYHEEDGWPKSAWSNGQFEATRRLICDWGDRDELINWIGTHPNNIYPYDEGPPDATTIYAGMEGMGEQGKETCSPTDGLRSPMVLATYPKALVTVKYNTEGPTYYGGTLISEWLLPDSEGHALEPAVFRWDNNAGEGMQPGETPYFTRYGFQYVIRYHQLYSVPGWVLTRVGTCNANTTSGNLLGLTFDPQTLLYQPPTIRTSVTTGKLTTYDVTVHYKYHPGGWNKFWRQSTSTYETIYLAGGSAYVQYPYSYALYGY